MPNGDYGICIFEGCGEPAKTRKHQLCGGHDSQMRRGRPLTERKKWIASDIDVEGMRRCTSCLRVLEEEKFYRRTTGGLQSRCKRCCIRDNRAATVRRQQRAGNAH